MEPLPERIRNLPGISEEAMGYLKNFITAKLGSLDPLALENALIVLGDGEAINRRNVGPLTFSDLLADCKHYYAVVHGYYDPLTSVLSYFSGRSPDNPALRHVAFVVDLERKIGGERIIEVTFHDGPANPHLKALEGMQVSGGFASASVDEIREALEKK